MISKNKLSVNRITKPDISVTDFMQLAADTGFSGIELRNDLLDPTVRGGESAEMISKSSRNLGINVITINALQRFNDPALFENKKVELEELVKEASAVGCSQIVFCPVNDPDDKRNTDEQKHDLEEALKIYAPILESNGFKGLIEPLGFSICSVRYKKQAVEAIKASKTETVYKIVHDTFHHFLSNETEVFPVYTGLVHVSGVYEGKKKKDINDEDRVLVDENDIMGNQEQVTELLEKGCEAVFSYEPFSSAVQKMNISDLKNGLIKSKNFLFS